MSGLSKRVEEMSLKIMRRRRQARLEAIRSELEIAQADCDALMEHIEWLVKRKAQLELAISGGPHGEQA